jgi:hypothetical protein
VFNAAYEAEDRISPAGAQADRPRLARVGVIGHLGSALACGLALELRRRPAQAMAISATAASGFIGAFGTMSKPLQLARGAADGLTAACLARAGFTGAPRLLESDPGFTVPLLGEAIADWSSVGRDWGRPYAVLRNSFKPHASCLITHPTIDAAMAMAERFEAAGLEPATIARVTCRVNPLAPKVAGHAYPATGLEGKFSVAWCCVAGLILGHATPAAVRARADRTRGPAGAAAQDRCVTDPRSANSRRQVELLLTDGQRFNTSPWPRQSGEPDDRWRTRKFLLLTESALGPGARHDLAQLRAFERIADVGARLRDIQPLGQTMDFAITSDNRPCSTWLPTSRRTDRAARRAVRARRALSARLAARMGELGLLEGTIPEEYGGLGLDHDALAAARGDCLRRHHGRGDRRLAELLAGPPDPALRQRRTEGSAT